MRSLGEITSSPKTGAGASSMSTSPEPRAGRVWQRLAEIHGARFLKEFGSAPNESWKRAIAKLTDHEIVRGLTNLAEDGLQHPPTLGQFVAACKRTPPVRYLGVETPRLPHQVSAEQRRENLEKLRRLMSGGVA